MPSYALNFDVALGWPAAVPLRDEQLENIHYKEESKSDSISLYRLDGGGIDP